MKWGHDIPEKFDLSSLRLLGSVGEPINPEAWLWYRKYIGGDRCPIVDTWWQTETGAIMISPLPGVTDPGAGFAQKPIPGVSAEILDDGATLHRGRAGRLSRPDQALAVAMLRGIWGDPDRYRETYWSRFGDSTFAGDGAKYDEDGNIWLLGRVDDVMNVSGHRMSTAEIESGAGQPPRSPKPRSSVPATLRPARRSSPSSSCARSIWRRPTRSARARTPSRSCATTSPRRSARSLPRTIMIVSSCPRRARARS